MRTGRPRVVGTVLLVLGLVMALALALAQSGEQTRLPELVILAAILVSALSITVGLFMIIKNRAVRTDIGPR